MSGSKHLAILVSANGFGHIRRQILIAAELLKRNTKLRVSFAITDTQYRRFKLEIENLGTRANAVVGVTEDSVRWRHDANRYSDANLNGWESEFKGNSSLVDADFVISDNLVGVLAARPDAILSGSFLWHEVISAHAAINESCRKFVEREIHLLQACHPKMICNADLATPAVLSLTDPVLMPWMVEQIPDSEMSKRASQSNGESLAVLVHGGGTRTLDERVRTLAGLLRASGCVVYTDLEDDSMCFDYQDSTWQKLGVVICRPGVGTATECVKWKIPIIVLRDQRNFEAEFIAEKLRELGLAHYFENQENDSIIAKVDEVMSMQKESNYLNPFERCVLTGIADAASFLLKFWNLSETLK